MVSEPFIWPPPPVVAGEPNLTTITDFLRLKQEPFSGPVPMENQSSEFLDVLEQRLETQITLVECNQQRLEHNISDIRGLKQAMSRIEACLQDLSGAIDGVAQHGQRNHVSCSFSSFRCTENIQFGTYGNTSSLYLKSQNKNTLPLIPPFTISHISEARIDETFKISKQDERESDAEELKIQKVKDHKLEESITSLTTETNIGDEETMGEVLDIDSARIMSAKGSQTSVVVQIESRQLKPLLSHEGDEWKLDEQKIQSHPFSSNSCSMLSKATLMRKKLIFDLMSLPCSASFSDTEYKEKPSLPSGLAQLNMNATTNICVLVIHRLERNSKFQAKFSFDGDYIWHRWKLRLAVLVKGTDRSELEEVVVISAIVISCIGPKLYHLFSGFKAKIFAEKVFSIAQSESNGQISKLEGSRSHVLGYCVSNAQYCPRSNKF